MPIFSMTQMDPRISELVARLTELERERAEIVAEINALRSVEDARAAAVKMVPLGRAGDPPTGIRQSKRKLLCFAGFSAADQMSSPSVGKIARRGGAATHPPVRM